MLSKAISALISPLGFALVFLGVALAAPSRFRRAAVGAALLWLWLWATPYVSEVLVRQLEAQAGARDLASVATAPVIVVLGGVMSGPRPPLRPYPDLGRGSDRVWHAARLFHAGKAPRILVSGGSLKDGVAGEAHAMRQFLLDLGVPEAAIWVEDKSTDTSDNAAMSARLLRAQGIDTIILVTSALHMRRAKLQFERTGLTIIPAPTDFEIADEPVDLQSFLPSAHALDNAGRAMKEILGYWVVKWAGRA